MTIKLTQIAIVVSLAAGLPFSLVFADSTSAPTTINNTASTLSQPGASGTTSTTTPTGTGTTSTATPMQPGSSSSTTSNPTPMTGSSVNTQTSTPSPVSPMPKTGTGSTPVTATPTDSSSTSPTTPTTTSTTNSPSSSNSTNNPTQIYVSPSTSNNLNTTTNSGSSSSGAPVVNGSQASTTQMGATPSNTTSGAMNNPSANGSTTANPANTNINQQQTAVIPQANLIDFSQKAAIAAFTYSYKDYAQSLENMESYFTKAGWDSFNKALTASNNLDVVQKEKLAVSATLNGQAEVTQHQQTATGQNWQVAVPIIVTYQNDKKQTVQQDLTVKLSIATVSTNENTNGIGITQFIAMPNVAPATTPAS